ncbi:bifunctional 4-hydroxy-2-oxoglutarate aldolase/2-dehydro-3-deoxy-phosphogluconate aldolase, partial [Microbacterium sp.]|uniref:bifunctional 4-hydroxy-2-oxoglutarate aldolase/2-dehydro-3-deoxy-phosphogluconate aldolase n=1 Tax=Microbacterium sp. TaxID=51671 RepID=UPI0035AE5BDC
AVASAGAAFAVTPGYDHAVAARLAATGVPLIPGIATPTEAMRAIADGFAHVKVFPAGQLGGPGYLDALNGPFPGLRYLPSGGVDGATLADYLARPHVFAASGSWMVPRDAVARGDFAAIVDAARECARVRDAVRSRP